MKCIEVQEKTVELAIEKGLQQLGCSIDKVETEVLSAGGLFTKAKVRLIKKDTVGEKAQTFLEEFFRIIKLGALVDMDEDHEEAVLNIVGTDLSLLYDNNGEVFDALQYLTALSANKDSDEYKRVVLESEDFRARREEQLQEYAQAMAQKAVKINRRIKLEPMNPYKRRIIHTKLQDFPGVTTHSEGEEPYRAIVIVPTNSRPSYDRRPNYNRRNDRTNYKNGQRGGRNYSNKPRSNSSGFNSSKTQKTSGFSMGSLIKRNSFDAE